MTCEKLSIVIEQTSEKRRYRNRFLHAQEIGSGEEGAFRIANHSLHPPTLPNDGHTCVTRE